MSLTKRSVHWIPVSPRTGAGGMKPAEPVSAAARWRVIVRTLHEFGSDREGSTTTLTAGESGSLKGEK
jgi:hypothetical protein